jgi:hypothetical protein
MQKCSKFAKPFKAPDDDRLSWNMRGEIREIKLYNLKDFILFLF